jgi:HemK-related putative methylase
MDARDKSLRDPGPSPVRHRLTAMLPSGVYPPREDTELLLPFAHVPAGRRLLEIGCGNGLLALTAAHAGARVVATDLNPEALRFLRRMARKESLDIDVVRTDLAAGLRRFDRILANPPYLPTNRSERDPDRGHNLALDGGRDGWRTASRIMASLPDHLGTEGEAYLVVSSRQHARGGRRVLAHWREVGGVLSVVRTRRIGRERLSVWRLRLRPARRGRRRAKAANGARRRARPRRRGIVARPPGRRANRSASNPVLGSGKSAARGAASIRRRSPRDS